MSRTSHRRRSRALPAAAVGATALALAGVGLAAGSAPAGATINNLLSNGGFETGSLTGWSCTGTASAVTSPVHSGSYALAATPSASDDAQCQQTVSVLPNTSYTLSGWVQGPYVYLGATGTGGTDPSTWSSQSGWNQLSTSFTTGASTTSVTVYLHGWYGQGTYNADDLTLTGPAGTASPTPSASSASPSPSSSPTPTASPTPTSSPTPTVTPTPPATGLPKHAVTGYWQDFDNGATAQKLGDVQSAYDIIAVSFANADSSTPGGITFALDPGLASKLGGYTDAQFKADIAAKHAAGKRVVLSVGGQNGTITVGDTASANNFADSAYTLIRSYGFDGVDIDLENGINPTYMSQALHTLAGKVGSGFVLTMAPQTIDMYQTSAGYFQLALNTRDILTVVNTQFYNSGGMNGCDGKVYNQGTEDFITSQICTHIQGGLDPSQVGIGVPASTSAAGGGYVAPSVVNAALDCLATGSNCGSFVPPAKWPGIRGAMTWSTNWDASNGNAFSGTVGAHVHAMP